MNARRLHGAQSRGAQQDAGRLDLLTAEFEAQFESLQTAVARAGMKRAFAATPKRMGKVSVAAARKAH
jgi:hypothetical protein